ncbi:flagellin [Halomonas vilamensis]|uniref:Flagellin n=1 Tax=Vreelandella vilamensis TaxID=531309 RepID=A0ABU1H7H4_9GAMM|nr:flagellin [Halomonas vilamensis]MDR5899473.1 flagellin [Halomonas vilamensis]
MAVIINTNTLSLKSQAHNTRANGALATAMERLSSGLRINSAKDDAAGQAMANRMEASLRAGDKITQGINDGISLMQTAEGGLDGINGLLQRGRQLSVQAANGTLSNSDREALHGEFLQLQDEIDRISFDTQAFDKHPLAPAEQRQLDAALGNTQTLKDVVTKGVWDNSRPSSADPIGFIPKGTKGLVIDIDSLGADDDIQLFTINGTHLVGTPLEVNDPDDVDYTWSINGIDNPDDLKQNLLNSANGFGDEVEYDDSILFHNTTEYDPPPGSVVTRRVAGMNIAYSGDGDWHDNGVNDGYNDPGTRLERVVIEEVNQPLFLAVAGNGHYNLKVDWDEMPDGPPPHPLSTDTDIVMDADFGGNANKLTIPATPSDSETLGLKYVNLLTQGGAGAAIETFDDALSLVDGYRSNYGALNNRFEGAIANLEQQKISTSAAQSRIMDADYALETANLVKAQIIQQASSSMLAQANQVPELALTLLQ